jgi:hypothetical protein
MIEDEFSILVGITVVAHVAGSRWKFNDIANDTTAAGRTGSA